MKISEKILYDMKEFYNIKTTDKLLASFELYKIRKEKDINRAAFCRSVFGNDDNVTNYNYIEKILRLPEIGFEGYFTIIEESKKLLGMDDLDIYSVYSLGKIEEERTKHFKLKKEFCKAINVPLTRYDGYLPVSSMKNKLKINKMIEAKIIYDRRYKELEELLNDYKSKNAA